jgi:hypothetical protein
MVVLAAHLWAEPISADRALEIKRWFWLSSLTARYAVGSNTVAVSDFKRLEAGGIELSKFVLDWEMYRDATKQSAGAIHRAWLCALAASSGARGDGLDASIPTPRSLAPYEVRAGSETSPHLLTLGFALVSDEQSVLENQFLPSGQELTDPRLLDDTHRARFLRERLEHAARFIGEECAVRVTVTDDPEQELIGRGD